MSIIESAAIEAHNEGLARYIRNDYEHLGEQLARRNIDIERVRERVARFGVAIPSWGWAFAATSSTRMR